MISTLPSASSAPVAFAAQAAANRTPIYPQEGSARGQQAAGGQGQSRSADLEFQYDQDAGVLRVQDGETGRTIYELRMGGEVAKSQIGQNDTSRIDYTV